MNNYSSGILNPRFSSKENPNIPLLYSYSFNTLMTYSHDDVNFP